MTNPAQPAQPTPALPKTDADFYNLEFHPAAELYPRMTDEELEELAEDIRTKGILNPIVLHDGRIIDGCNRYRAAKKVGHCFSERDFKQLPPGLALDLEAFVVSVNDRRRQLTSKQKRAVIAKLIASKPHDSDRQIAKRAGCDNKTVASVREEVRGRTRKFLEDWESLSGNQRAEFVTTKRDELKGLLTRL